MDSYRIALMVVTLCATFLPILSWSVSADRQSTAARLWFASALMHGIVCVVLLLRMNFNQPILEDITRIFSHTGIIFTTLFARSINNRTTKLVEILEFFAIGLLLYIGILICIGWIFAFQFAIFMFILLKCYIFYELHLAYKKLKFHGIILIQISILSAIIANISRIFIVKYVKESDHISTNNGLITTFIAFYAIFISCYSSGYVAFSMELFSEKARKLALKVSESRLALATTQARADSMAQLVAERDHMLVLNARFSVLNDLSLFSGALVHEIAQPLQAAICDLDALSHVVSPQRSARPDLDVDRRLGVARDRLDKVASLLGAYRSMLRNNSPALAPIEIAASVEKLLPIIRSEADLAGIAVSAQIAPEARTVCVMANAIMFERAVMNLATNALLAMGSDNQPAAAWLAMSVAMADRGERQMVVVEVSNSADCPIDHLSDHLFDPLVTHREGGMGLGLALVRATLESWGGSIAVRKDVADAISTKFVIELPAWDGQ